MPSDLSDLPTLEAKIERLAQIKQIIEDKKALLANTICTSPPKDRKLSSILSEVKGPKFRSIPKKKTFSRSAANEYCAVMTVIVIIIAFLFRLLVLKDYSNQNYF